MEEEINLVDILKVLFKRRKMIVWFFIIAITLVFFQSATIVRSAKYKATVSLMVTSESGGLFSALSQIPFLNTSSGRHGGDASLMVVLKSQSLAKYLLFREPALRSFLLEQFKRGEIAVEDIKLEKGIEKAIKRSKEINDDQLARIVSAFTEIKTDKNDPLIYISFSSSDAKMAARVANIYPVALGEFLSQKSIPANFRVLDPAIVPRFPEYSRRRTFKKMLFAGIAGIFFAVLIVFILEFWGKQGKDFLEKLEK